MRQLQVTVPASSKKEVQERLEKHSSDVSSSHVEKDGSNAIEFTVSIDSDDIDEVSEELKGIENIDSGDLSIRVLEQESLIEKGQKTKGSSTTLSNEEIYSKAQESAEFTKEQWALIAVSSAIAAYGLALDNVIVVIGAMMLAPMLSPFVSGAISIVVGDRSLMLDSLSAGLKSVLIAIAVSFVVMLPFPVGNNPVIDLVVSPGILTVLLSILVGSAAALSFATGFRDQIAGVAVAIALVPPLAAVGIGLKMQDAVFVLKAASVATINLLAVLVSGSVTFRLLGMTPSTYYQEKQAEKLRYVVSAAFVLLVLLAAPVVYTSYQGYQDYVVEQDVRNTAEEHFGEDLMQLKFSDSEVRVLVLDEHDVEAFRSDLPDHVSADVRQLKTG